MAIDSNTIENVKAKIPYGFDVNAKLEKKDKEDIGLPLVILHANLRLLDQQHIMLPSNGF
jgi:hypothetical protein